MQVYENYLLNWCQQYKSHPQQTHVLIVEDSVTRLLLQHCIEI